MSLVGITGRKFNGKDTLGRILIERYGYVRLAFADPLKEACRNIFGFTDEQLYGDLKETDDTFWQTTPRRVLQYVGTDLLRNQLANIMPQLGTNIWVEALRRRIDIMRHENPDIKIVVTDVRFENEVEMIKRLSGTVIRVSRPSVNTSIDVHSSEINIDNLNVDHQILNEGTLHDLEDAVKLIMDKF